MNYSEPVDHLYHLLHKVENEVYGVDQDFRGNYRHNVAYICLKLAFEYYHASVSLIEDGKANIASIVSRTAIENLADMIFILESDDDQFAMRYVNSRSDFYSYTQKFGKRKLKNPLSKRQSRAMNKVNNWTGDPLLTITKRIESLDRELIFEYDMLSYFAHPNPVQIDFMLNMKMMGEHTKLLVILNVNIILVAIAMMKLYGPTISSTEEDIDLVGRIYSLDVFGK